MSGGKAVGEKGQRGEDLAPFFQVGFTKVNVMKAVNRNSGDECASYNITDYR